MNTKTKKFDLSIDNDVLTYGDSLLYPSGLEIASISCKDEKGNSLWVSLRTQGEVCLYYKGEVYKDVSQFPDELIDAIKKGNLTKLIDNDELEIRENNWWEFCYSNGDGDLLGESPSDYNSIGDLVADLTNYLIDLIGVMETNTFEVIWDTDDEVIEELPKQVEVPANIPEDDVADWLSDKYGWCVNSFYKVNVDNK